MAGPRPSLDVSFRTIQRICPNEGAGLRLYLSIGWESRGRKVVTGL